MLTPKETGGTGGGGVYPLDIPYSALCESGYSSTGAVATNCTIALGFKPTVVDTSKPLCDPTNHYLLAIRKAGTAVSVETADGNTVHTYTTTATTDAGLLAEALTEACGSTAGYYSLAVVAESDATPSNFFQVSGVVSGLWVVRKTLGVPVTTLLDFSDAADLGHDSSGNGNDWTLTGAIQSLDTPTNNCATFNPLVANGYKAALSQGNLKSTSSGSWKESVATMEADWPFYLETTVSVLAASNYFAPGVLVHSQILSDFPGHIADSWGFTNNAGSLLFWNAGSSGGAGAVSAWAATDKIGVAVNPQTGKIWLRHNGAWLLSGDPASDTNPTGTFTPQQCVAAVGGYGATAFVANFGQSPFEFTPPDGFLPLACASIPDDTYALAGTHKGNGSATNGPVEFTGCTLATLTIDGTTYTNDGNSNGVVVFLSNGYKLTSTTHNTNGVTYDWTGTLKTPFKYSNAQSN